LTTDAGSKSTNAARIDPTAAGILAWLVPGLGHMVLGYRARGLAFFALVVGSLLLGAHLEGELGATLFGPPLAVLRTVGCMGAGMAYAFLRFVVGYVGSAEAGGFEYGSAFLVTAGLMNWMLVLDALDLAAGRRS